MSSQNMLLAVGKRPKDSIRVLTQRGLNTASSLEYVQYVAAQSSGTGVIPYKRLFSECGLWCREKSFGTTKNNQFCVKMTEARYKHLPEAEPVAPHGGRPGMYLVEEPDDREFLTVLVLDTHNQLLDPSLPKRK